MLRIEITKQFKSETSNVMQLKKIKRVNSELLKKLQHQYKGKGLKEIDPLVIKAWISLLKMLNEDITELIEKGFHQHFENGLFNWWIGEINTIIEQIGEILYHWT